MTRSATPSVLWREGMFLAPQHMQAYAREVSARIAQLASVGRPGFYGWRRLEIDEDALARDTFVIAEAEALFADGTAALIPETASLERRDFGDVFTRQELDVFVGVPAARPNVPQVGEENGRFTRYRVETAVVFDENMRDSSKEIEFRYLQARLFFGDEDRTGFECLPVARIVRRGQPETVSCLSETFVPPIVACGASKLLMRALKDISADARSHARDLAARIPPTAVLSSAAKGADLAGFVKLQAVNRSLAALEVLASLPELHPLDAYLWLMQVVGNLAVFGEDRVVPELPGYDHDALHVCFPGVLQHIRRLLAADVAIPYDRVSFEADPTRDGFYECEIPQDWLRFQPTFFLAVELAEPPERIERLVTDGLKLVAAQDVDQILRGVVPGVVLSFARNPPLSFPKKPELHYFRVEVEGPTRQGWLNVLQTRRATVLSALADRGAAYHFYVELRQ